MGAKCLSNVFTVCILAYISWLTVTVRACAGFLWHECACIDTVRVCTGDGFPQYRYASQYWLWSPTVHVCAGSFHSMCVYWSWSPTARVCAGSFHCTSVYWLCCPTARVCTGSFTVYVCNEAYNYLMVNIRYMLMVRGVVVGWLITLHAQVCENDTCTIYIHVILCMEWVCFQHCM